MCNDHQSHKSTQTQEAQKQRRETIKELIINAIPPKTMNIYQGQLEEHLKKEEHGRRSSLDGHTMETSKRDNRHHRHRSSGKGHHHHHSSGKGHHPSHRQAQEESLDERTFPSESYALHLKSTRLLQTSHMVFPSGKLRFRFKYEHDRKRCED